MRTSKVSISPEDVKLILDELELNRPFEACGVLVGVYEGDIAYVKRTVPIKNSRRTERSFELDPVEFYNAWDTAEKENMDLIGVYHTHPESNARPSDWDQKSMENSPPIWLIAGIDGIFAYELFDMGIREIAILR
ncbi:proteasome lid subunit RPN8/RPN11 [Methanohalophilus levihalophilus]|uniref:M67 family metallopeptidase n=1 Tax=Methanohalophilus levihalophilus TaxID=1431282 RepID=UPI001AE95C61|nr:M67 family metallopeptidase [Methanohalophilus levihalophilus]MBP2031253.1 proteasome lid subunit RPN8/RPN11 [Methanohalophilus levihalophilus]